MQPTTPQITNTPQPTPPQPYAPPQPEHQFQPIAPPQKTKINKNIIIAILATALVITTGLVVYFLINTKDDEGLTDDEIALVEERIQQRQRDTQRKQDLAHVIQGWNSYISNNAKFPNITTLAKDGVCEGARGNLQTDYCQLDTYVALDNGRTYSILDGPSSGSVIHQDTKIPNATHENIAVYRKAICGDSDNGDIFPGDSLRQAAAVVLFEEANNDGAPVYYCYDNVS